jgi:hypothetical protein
LPLIECAFFYLHDSECFIVPAVFHNHRMTYIPPPCNDFVIDPGLFPALRLTGRAPSSSEFLTLSAQSRRVPEHVRISPSPAPDRAAGVESGTV